MKPTIKSLIAAGALLLSGHSMAGTVSVEWVSPQNYTDIAAEQGEQSRFNQRVFYHLEKQFRRLAGELPDGYHWQVSVTDVNLAGSVSGRKYQGMGEFPPGIPLKKSSNKNCFELSWQVTDARGNVIAKNEDDAVEFTRKGRKYNHSRVRQPFTGERYLLKYWFYQVMLPQLDAGQPSGVSGKGQII